MRLFTQTEGDFTYYSWWVQFLHWLSFKAHTRAEKIMERSWQRAHGKPDYLKSR